MENLSIKLRNVGIYRRFFRKTYRHLCVHYVLNILGKVPESFVQCKTFKMYTNPLVQEEVYCTVIIDFILQNIF